VFSALVDIWKLVCSRVKPDLARSEDVCLGAMGLCRKPLQAREVKIIRNLKKKLKLAVTKIAAAVERNKTSVYKALDPKWTACKRGRKDAIGAKGVAHIIRTLNSMIKKAKGLQEITLRMVKRKSKCKAGLRCIREHLQKKGIRFRRLRSKCILSAEDVKARFKFAKKYRRKTKVWWLRNIDLHIDLKNFQVYLSAAARDMAARREVRGAYRKLGQGLDDCYVQQPKSLRYNTGCKPVKIAAGVGKGRVHMWAEMKGKWTGAKAAAMYSGPLKSALKSAAPRKRVHTVLEDNDPTGFKSKLAEKAKRAEKIKIFKIPPRSPDLSVCDYALWKQITRKMRKQEAKFPKSKRETRAEYVRRLERAAKGLTAEFVKKAIGDMRVRVQRLYEAGGKHFEEGGSRK
jgi:hypothetical protein